ncbi:hypothetical protein Tco_0484024 [Tanacetum coccineum]
MIHLVIHLPLEALEGGPIRPRWMYPFERFMKKLKNYVRNKAKPEGSIAEGYVAEEALTFSSHYFRDVTIKFNRPDHNVDCPPPTCQFQVFRSVCKSIGLRSVIRIDHQELKKVIWYVLHNSPEIDTYRVKFKSQFPNKDMKEEFPTGLGRNHDERRTTQNNGICSPGKDREMYYGQLEEILEFSYMSFKTLLFRVKWFDTSNKGRVKHLVIRNNITQILENDESFKNDHYILVTQVKQCFYLEDMAIRPLGWKVIQHVNHKTFSNEGVIMAEDDPNIIHVDNSSDLPLSTSLNDLEIAALHIDGQSIDVDAPPDIIDVDEDDDIIDDEDVLPYDLANSDDEDLVNVDDDNGVAMSADVARGHDGDGGGDDRPPPHQIVGGCRGSGKNFWILKADRMRTRKETRNLGLRKITDELGPQPIRFEWKDNGTMLPLDDHSSYWANLLRKIVREFPMHFGFWRNIPAKRKAGVLGKIETQFDLKPYMQSELLLEIRKSTDQHLDKIYTDNKSSLKKDYWVKNPDDETYDIRFWSDPKNMARCAQNAQNGQRARSYASRDPDAELSDSREEMQRLQALGEYIDDQIMVTVRKGTERGHILGFGRVLAGRRKDVLDVPVPRCNHTSDVNGLKRNNKQLKKHIDMITKNGSRSGMGGDDESGNDEDVDEDEEDAYS